VSNHEQANRGLMQSRMVQLALVVVAVGIVLIVAGVVVFFSYRASRDKPLKVKLYPGATLVNSETVSGGFKHQQYVSDDPFEDVEQFFAKQDDMVCQRQYRVVQTRPGQEPIKEDPQYTRCQIDHSGLGVTQYTTVLIQPVRDANDAPTGQIVIDVQQHWGK
jgi:hypothetical protein